MCQSTVDVRAGSKVWTMQIRVQTSRSLTSTSGQLMLKQETFRQGGEKMRALTAHFWALLNAVLVGDVEVLSVPTELPRAIATVEVPPQFVAYRATL